MRLTRRQTFGIVLAFLAILCFLSPTAKSFYNLQGKQHYAVGDSLQFILKLPPQLLERISVQVTKGEKILNLEKNAQKKQNQFKLGLNSPVLVEPGRLELQLELFGLIPLKKIAVEVTPEIHLLPGGQSIGVLLRTEGVMVVGFSPVLDEEERPSFPGRDAGIDIGDTILEINGIKTDSDDQVKKIIADVQKKEVTIKLKRKNKIWEKVVKAEFCQDSKSYRIGLFVRDNAGGIGTLTFYEPFSGKYGALGHLITDNETNQRITIRAGKIVPASVENVHKAKEGSPGEKVGAFVEDSELGDIRINDDCGIYGQIKESLDNPLYTEPIPIAFSPKIKPGRAKILTVVHGQEIKAYEIMIEKTMIGRPDGKNMIIRIVDKELLKQTGGIIQGMSGSPIIQDEKLVGAVTHVFLNDPERGYGVFIENMLLEAGIIRPYEQLSESALRLDSQGIYYGEFSRTKDSIYLGSLFIRI